MKRICWTAALLLLALALPLLFTGARPAAAQEVYTPIELDQAHFGMAKVDSLAPGAEAYFVLSLKEGDRVVMEVQGETDSLQVTRFDSPYEPLTVQSPAPSIYTAWATGDGDYSITVKNTGNTAAGFTLRVVASPAPRSVQRVIAEDWNGQTIPLLVGEAFQVALDAQASDGYAWTLQDFDTAVLEQMGEPAAVLLGTMPGAMSEQIFTFSGMAAGTATLTFDYAKEGSAAEKSFSVTIEVNEPEATPTEAEGPAVQPLAVDKNGKAQATGSLEPQGMAAYIVTIAAGAQVQAAITPADSGMILTVVGTDGNPLQTDHVGASNFDQTMPASQEYIFKVINFGESSQEYTFDITVTLAGTGAEETAAPIVPQPIQLDQGKVLVIPLAGNPSTGYLWQVEPSAEGILTLRGDAAFTAPADAPGTPGYEIFTFDATGAGEVTLTFTHSQPWDETTPPEQMIDLSFVVNAPAAAELPAPPEPVMIGPDQNGGAVEVQVGGKLFVDLSGNPTTGYIWQVTDVDDTLLNPTDYAFQPDSDLTGAGGIEHFEFDALAPGEVKLALAQSRPWETDAEPSDTFSVTVTVSEAPAN